MKYNPCRRGPRLLRILPSCFAVVVFAAVACDDPVAPAPDDVQALLIADGIPEVREVRRAFTLDSIQLYTVTYGEPQDCPSGCFYLSGTLLKIGSRIGWIELPDAGLYYDPDRRTYFPDTTKHTFFQVRPTDAPALNERLFNTIGSSAPRDYATLRAYLGMHPGTPESVLAVLADRIPEEGWPYLAWVIVTHPTSQCSRPVLTSISELEGVNYAEARLHARSLLESYAERCA